MAKYLGETGLVYLWSKIKTWVQNYVKITESSGTKTIIIGTVSTNVYDKPSTGIPKTDLAQGIQNSLDNADSAYQKPSGGIPASDLASGVIPDVSQFITKSVDDLANYYTKSQTYTQTEVQQLINAVKQFIYELVNALPTASASTMNKIYLVPSSDPQSQNIKNEYITIESSGSYSWEQIGSTAIDLSGYVTTTALNTALADYTTSADLATLLTGYQTKIDATHKLDYSLVSNTPTKISDFINDSGFITTEADPVFSASAAHDITSSDISNWNSKGTYSKPSGGIPKSDLASAVQTSLGKADTALQSYTETDPTVPSWAKASSKPSYTASEVGAVPTTRTVNGKALSADITLSASDVDALPSSTVIPDAQIQSDWNQTTTTAKDYIKNKPTIPTVPTISTNITTDASSDSKTASPKAVKTYVDSVKGDTNIIETVKVNGTALTPTNKAVDVIVPTKVSDLTNDSGFIDGMVILSYGSSTWSNFISAYNKNKVVYCRASSNANPATGTQSRLAFMAYVEGTTTPTSVEFQYYRSVKNHSASQQGDQVFVYTLKNTGVWSVIVREASTKIVAGTGLSSSYSNDTLTITANSFTESDPVFGASAAAGITSSDISNWNSKTSNIGTITGINMNGASKGTSGVVDLGTVITAHQDISGKADKVLIVNHGTSDTTYAVTPNVLHVWGTVTSLTLTLATPTDNTIVNEYMFEFTSGSTATTLSLPSSVEWAESCGVLSVEANKTYQISIVNNIGLWAAISNS